VFRRSLKKVSLGLAAVFLITAVAGCSKPPVKDAATPTPTPAPTEEVRDLGGRTIRMSAFWDEKPKAGTPDGDKLIARMAELEKKYNCKFEFLNTPFDKTSEKYAASVMAGDPFAEIVATDARWFLGLAGKGFVTPLNDLIDLKNTKWDPMTIKATTLNGKVYGMRAGKMEPNGMFFFNKKIFSTDGLPNLYELQKNKQWTWDKFREIAKKATKDTDGDGKIDQWGFGHINGDLAFIVSNGGISIDSSAQKPKVALNTPEAVQALEFYYNLVNVDKVVFSKFTVDKAPYNAAQTKFEEGKIAMLSYQYWITSNLVKKQPGNYGLVHFPMGPSNKSGDYRFLIETPNYKTIPKNVKNPQDIAFIYNKLTEPYPGDDKDSWKATYEPNLCDKESMETLDYMYKNNTGVYSGMPDPLLKIWAKGQDDLLKGEKTVSQVLEERIEPLQKQLDDMFAQ